MPRRRKSQPKREEQAPVNTRAREAKSEAALGLCPPLDCFGQRPILCAILERCGELAREASTLPPGSAEQRAIDRRIQKLDAYTFPPLYQIPVEQDAILRRFAQALLAGGVYTVQQVNELTKEFAARMFSRPVGRPVNYRYRVTEAYEIKRATKRSWPDIAAQLGIPHLDLVRQVRAFKALLRAEGISATTDREHAPRNKSANKGAFDPS